MGLSEGRQKEVGGLQGESALLGQKTCTGGSLTPPGGDKHCGEAWPSTDTSGNTQTQTHTDSSTTTASPASTAAAVPL